MHVSFHSVDRFTYRDIHKIAKSIDLYIDVAIYIVIPPSPNKVSFVKLLIFPIRLLYNTDELSVPFAFKHCCKLDVL